MSLSNQTKNLIMCRSGCIVGVDVLLVLMSTSARVGPVWIQQKSAPGNVMLNLCFCIRWDQRVKYCLPVRPVSETSTHCFSCSGGTGTDQQIARRDTLHRSCVFASGGNCGSHSAFWYAKHRHTIFMLRWDRYGINK
jgi:hypothetical protein